MSDAFKSFAVPRFRAWWILSSVRWLVVAAGLLGLSTFASTASEAAGAPPARVETSSNAPKSGRVSAGLPMSFEMNQGQFDPDIKFRSRGAAYSVELRSTEAVLMLGDVKTQKRAERSKQGGPRSQHGPHPEPLVKSSVSAVVQLSLSGANPDAEVGGESQLPGIANYFLGNDPARWRTAVPVYEKVRYSRIYPGIDLIYYGNQRQLEYDFLVAPAADPENIRFRLGGVDSVSVEASGDLIAQIGTRQLRWQKPHAFQTEGQGQRKVTAEFVVNAANEISFRVGQYDRARPLVIDPLLVYSSYLGGGDFDMVSAVAVDGWGNLYLTGYTASTNFPVSPGYHTSAYAPDDIFITKLNSDATAIVFSTYLGGSSNDWANAIAVDTSSNVYVVGYSESPNYPLKNSAQSYSGFGDAILTKLGPRGTNLLYSTYLGGPNYDEAFDVAVDNSGNAFLVGTTYDSKGNFPSVPNNNPFPGPSASDVPSQDVFVADINTTANGSGSVSWAGYLGGAFDEYGYAIALDNSGNVYVTGDMLCQAIPGDPCPGQSGSGETGFPTLNAFQSSFGGGYADAFLAKITSAGPSLAFSTYLGGSDDEAGFGVAVDSSNNVYVTGETISTDFPILNGMQSVISGDFTVAFLAKFGSSGNNLLYSTFYGGSGDTGARSIVLDRFRNAYISGYSSAMDLPVTPGAPQANRAGTNFFNRDLFAAKFNPAVPGPSSLVFATYFGGADDEGISIIDNGWISPTGPVGLAVDTNLNIYLASDTVSSNLPTTAGVLQTTSHGDFDGFAVKIAPTPDISASVTASTNIILIGSNLIYTVYANNNGLTTFSNVTVTDVLPAMLSYASGTNTFPGGTINNSSGTVTCMFNNMTNGAAGVATITAMTLSPGTVANTVTLASSQSDLNTNNNTASVVTIIRGVMDLAVTMTAATNTTVATSNLSYSITVTNRGPWPATADQNTVTKAIVVQCPVPAGTTYVGASGGFALPLFDGSSVRWFINNLPSSGTTTLSLTVQPMTVGSLVLTSSVSGYFELDTVAANNSASASATVIGLSDLAIGSLTDAPDPVYATSNLTYTISVTNAGPTIANAAQIVDTLPSGFAFVSATASGGYTQFQGVVTCYLGNLSTGAIATATITAKPPVDGFGSNYVSASSSSIDPVPTNNLAWVMTTVNPLANLAIANTVSSTNVVVTSNVVYTISVTNLGPTSSYGVVVTDSLPQNLAFVSAQSSQGTCNQNGGIVICNLGTVTNSGRATIAITGAPMIEGRMTNTATVAATSSDPVSGNNSSSVTITVTNHPNGPILRIAKSGTNVLLYWTTNSAGYSLQSNTNLASTTSWQSVTNTPRTIGTQFYVTNSIGPSPKYYRLSKVLPLLALDAALSGNSMVVSWSTNLTGFFLQRNDVISPTNTWTTLSNITTIQNDRFIYSEPATNTRRFFRLVKFSRRPTLKPGRVHRFLPMKLHQDWETALAATELFDESDKRG